MDTIATIAFGDAKLGRLCEKLGYRLISIGKDFTPSSLDESDVVDLVIAESGEGHSFTELRDFMKGFPAFKESSLIFVSGDSEEILNVKTARYDHVEVVEKPISVGLLASKIATSLRMRKISGSSKANANLSEINAALRDLNERYRKELEEANGIQNSLLPKDLPKSDLFEVAVLYDPLEEVGGDFYYARILDNGHLSVQLADVTGHGLAAAFIGAMARLALFAGHRDLPGPLFEEMNKLLSPNLPSGRFITMTGFTYNPENGECIFARAGHPPALIRRAATKEIEESKSDGFPFGFMDDGEYSEYKAILNPGDIVILVTDGITEGQNRDNDMFDFPGLRAALTSLDIALSAGETLRAIQSIFNDFLGGRVLKDDVTAIVLKRLK